MQICPVCQSAEPAKCFAVLRTPYLERDEIYRVLCCIVCGHGSVEGRQDAAYLERIYSSGFHSTSQQATDAANSPANMNAHVRAAWMAARFSGRLLDVGAGKGAFVAAASDKFDAQGIEISETAAAHARGRGLHVATGNFLTMQLDREAFDVVSFWDVLASMPDPARCLAIAERILKPGGVVAATVPLIDSWTARLLRRFWPLLIPPVNLHYFTRESIGRLAAAHGFEVLSGERPGKKVALSFLAAKSLRTLGLHTLADVAAKRLPGWPLTVNLGDIGFFILRKPALPS